MWSPFWPHVGIKAAFIFIYVLCLISVHFRTKGLTRTVFRAKAIILISALHIMIGERVVWFIAYGNMDLNVVLNIAGLAEITATRADTIKTEANLIFGETKTSETNAKFLRMYTFQAFENCFLLMDQNLTFMLVHSLFICTCKMTVKKFSVVIFLGKCIIGLVILILAYSLETFILSMFMKKLFEAFRLALIVMPVSMLVSTITTLLSLFYGIRVLISLKKSQKFRETANANATNRNVSYCSVLVVTLVCIQTIKWVAQLVRLTWSLARPNAFQGCEVQGQVSQSCLNSAFSVFKYIDLITAVFWYSFIEFLFVVFPVIPIKIGGIGRIWFLKLSNKIGHGRILCCRDRQITDN